MSVKEGGKYHTKSYRQSEKEKYEDFLALYYSKPLKFVKHKVNSRKRRRKSVKKKKNKRRQRRSVKRSSKSQR